MPLSHVTPGEPATDYRWRGIWTVGGGAVGVYGVRALASSVITWGIPFPAEGIAVSAYAYDPAVGTPGGEIRFSSPWFADQVVTLLSYTGGTWEVEIDELELTRTNCVDYEWSYAEVRLYVDSVLIYTGGPNAGSGTGAYDHRYNRCRLAASTDYDPNLICNPATCPGVNLTIWPTSKLVGGYQRNTGSGWSSDAVLIDGAGFTKPIAIPACGPCACFPTAPRIAGTDSYEVEVNGARKYVATADSRAHDCYCLDGSFGGAVTEYQSDEDAVDEATWAHVVGEDHGIRTRVIAQRSCCNCVCPPYTDIECRTTTTTMPSAKTYCETYRASTGWQDTVYCWSGFVVCPDPPGVGRCGQADDVFCAFDAYVHVYWPADTSCGDFGSPHNSRDFLGRYTRVSTRNGQLWLLRADAGSPRGGWHHELLWGSNVESPRGLWNREFDFELVYRDTSDGGVYWTRSTDDQQTFETPEPLFMSAKYPDAFHDSRWTGFAVFKHDAGSSGVGKIYLRLRGPDDNAPGAEFTVKDAAGVAISFEDESFGITVPSIGPSAWVLTAKKAGDSEPSEWESTDNGASWEQV